MADTNGKYYTIIAGRVKPEEVEMGFLNKETGLPKGQTQKIMVTLGVIDIPNYSRVWARRVNEKSKKDDRSLTVTDREYKGKLEFLDYNDPRGELVEIRYIPTSNSLDKQYQEQVQKILARDEDIYITFLPGSNDYDPIKQSLLVEMLKHHVLNLNSKSRNPDSTEWTYVEYSTATRKNKIQQVAVRRDAEGIVLDAEKDEDRLKVLASIYRLDAMQQDDVLLDQLFQKVSDNPERFMSILSSYKEQVHETIQHLIDEEALFMDADSTIQIIEKGKKQVLLNDVEGDDKVQKVMWVINHILEPNVFSAVQRMDAVKKELLAAVN